MNLPAGMSWLTSMLTFPMRPRDEAHLPHLRLGIASLPVPRPRRRQRNLYQESAEIVQAWSRHAVVFEECLLRFFRTHLEHKLFVDDRSAHVNTIRDSIPIIAMSKGFRLAACILTRIFPGVFSFGTGTSSSTTSSMPPNL